MSKQPESVFKDRIKPKLGALGFFEKIQQEGIRGTPDILGCIGGFFIALELKKDARSKPSQLQVFKLIKIYQAGGLAFVVSPKSWEEIHVGLKSLRNQEKFSYCHLRELSRANLRQFTGKTNWPSL